MIVETRGEFREVLISCQGQLWLKRKWLKVSHLECDLHQQLIISSM